MKNALLDASLSFNLSYFTYLFLSDWQAEVTDTAVKLTITKCSDENVKIGNKTHSTGLSDQHGRPIGDQAAVHLQNSEYLEKLQLNLAAKENELSQAALGVLLSKRQKLVLLFFFLKKE